MFFKKRFFQAYLFLISTLTISCFSMDGVSYNYATNIAKDKIQLISEQRIKFNKNHKFNTLEPLIIQFLPKDQIDPSLKILEDLSKEDVWTYEKILELIGNDNILLAQCYIQQRLFDEISEKFGQNLDWAKFFSSISELNYLKEISSVSKDMVDHEDYELHDLWNQKKVREHILEDAINHDFIKLYNAFTREKILFQKSSRRKDLLQNSPFYQKIANSRGLCSVLCNFDKHVDFLYNDPDGISKEEDDFLKKLQNIANIDLLKTTFQNPKNMTQCRFELCKLHVKSQMHFFKKAMPIHTTLRRVIK